MRKFFEYGLEIDNETAVDNLIAAGYNDIDRLRYVPPSGDDLDKLGFNMYQRNLTLKVLATIIWRERDDDRTNKSVEVRGVMNGNEKPPVDSDHVNSL